MNCSRFTCRERTRKNSYMSMNTQTKPLRQSNIELLRIVAMFLVMVLHADSNALGNPTLAEFHTAPVASVLRIFLSSMSIVCVNAFVLITGWFGIRPSLKGYANFAFQCLYFYFGIYGVMMLTGHASFSLMGVAYCFNIFAPYWFVLTYTALYFMSPVLNAFVETSSKRQFQTVLILIFAYESIYGWTGSAWYIHHGFSFFSFAGLYLLARYIHIYGIKVYKSGGGNLLGISCAEHTAMLSAHL